MYPIIEIPVAASETSEQVGTKFKFWYDEHSKMFKLGREGTGEHWSEKISCELCELLGLPHAHYEFATWNGRLGTTTDNFVPPRGRLVLGNELLASFSPGYDGTRRYQTRQHSVGRVIAVLEAPATRAPSQWPPDHSLSKPKDFFAGYILFDAWIGNTDRHHENWGLVNAAPNIFLAPTFDHASSLGRELSDEVRLERLTTRDGRRSVTAYAARARSALYRTESDPSPLSTTEAFKEVARRAPAGAHFWYKKLANVTSAQIDAILEQVPGEAMSVPARQFVRCLLSENQARICSDPEVESID
jgi:hypothetical protein